MCEAGSACSVIWKRQSLSPPVYRSPSHCQSRRLPSPLVNPPPSPVVQQVGIIELCHHPILVYLVVVGEADVAAYRDGPKCVLSAQEESAWVSSALYERAMST